MYLKIFMSLKIKKVQGSFSQSKQKCFSLYTGRIQFKVLTAWPMTIPAFFLEFHLFMIKIEKIKWQFSEDIHFVIFRKFLTKNLRYL